MKPSQISSKPFTVAPRSIVQLQDSLVCEKKRLEAELRGCKRQLQRSCFDTLHRGRWVNVKQVTLAKGDYYFIRRAWKGDSDPEPCLAEWREGGWRIAWGNLGSQYQEDATIDVYEWE